MTLRPYYADVAAATRGTVYVLGDSLERGFGTTGGLNGWPTIRSYVNLGINGAAWESTNQPTTPEIHSGFTGIPRTGQRTIVVAGCVNNLGLGHTAFSICQRILRAERSAWLWGAANVLIKTITPFGSTMLGFTAPQVDDVNYRRLEVNTWIRETYTQRGQCIDGNAAVGGDVMNPAHNFGDGVHLNDAGQAALAASLGPQVTSLTL